ncbi:MAG: hypothetical protein ABJO09_01110 [Hyphomicrobiales bacterium]
MMQNLNLTASEADLSSQDVLDMVRLRLIEAADTVRRSYGTRGAPSTKATWWPETGDKTEYPRDGSPERPYLKSRSRPDAAALSRADEVNVWISEFIGDDAARFALTNWAICTLISNHGHSFVRWCEKNGINRRTANRHVHKAIKDIALNLCKSGVLLRAPDAARVSQFLPKQGINQINIARVETWCRYGESVQLRDLPEQRDFTWASKQNERRKQAAERESKQAPG